MKLSQKGIILVLVPVAFECVFVGSLFYMLSEAQQQLTLATKAHRISSHLNKIQRLQMVIAGGLPVYLNSVELHGPQKNRLTNERIKEEFVRLKESTKDDPALLDSAEKMERSLSESMAITANLKSAWALIDRVRTAKVKNKGKGLTDDLTHEIESMWNQVDKIERESPIRLAENRQHTKILLLLGLGINVSLAIGLAFYFNRDTVSRLSRVMDNARSLAEGRPLNSPLSGSDEIAMLDRAFAKMAMTRDEFAEKERALLIHAADVICSLDADGIITDVSPACRKIWGFEPLELLSLRLQEIVFPEDISSTTEHIEQAKKLTESSFENRIKRKDGGLVDMLWSVKWSPADSSFFCVAHDNTERKSAERMKADFVAMLSHDLRSPLNSVQAFFTMVGDKVYGALSDKGMAKVAMLESTVSWLIELISNLLDIDKIEAGLAELELRQVSIKELVGKAHAALEALAEKRNVLVELPDIDATINADSDMFLRVITNLLSNAIKFAPENSRVKVEIENVDGFVEMRIVDAGKGIAPENQQAIFERFRQVRGEGDNKTRSSGLGLAVAKVIVEQHKGTIGVRSALGQGSTFWVRLPAVARSAHDA